MILALFYSSLALPSSISSLPWFPSPILSSNYLTYPFSQEKEVVNPRSVGTVESIEGILVWLWAVVSYCVAIKC